MIRRKLLTVSVMITDPQTSVSRQVMDTFERRTATGKEAMGELLMGQPIKKKAEGIELVLGTKFRLPTDEQAQQLRDGLRKGQDELQEAAREALLSTWPLSR
jgi:hypothetical protein